MVARSAGEGVGATHHTSLSICAGAAAADKDLLVLVFVLTAGVPT
jgi:hypothetical protein